MSTVHPPNESKALARHFDDDTMAQFIERGFVSVEPELPGDFHEHIHRQTLAAFASGNPGNNILPLVPELQTIFEEPRVRGALASILGPDYAMHPHRHCHVNLTGSDGQRLHKDAFSVRYHRIQEALAFYYPHDVDEDMGPTAVVPGSQYHGKQLDDEMPELLVCGKAGPVTVAHYDLWHRGTPNRASADRYMIKFLFTRMSQPHSPSWDSNGEPWPREDSVWSDLHSTIWDWHRGQAGSSPLDNGDDLVPLLERLGEENESSRLRAAYRLGRMGESAVGPLGDKLKSADEEIRHAAGYALSAIGPAATEAVSSVVESASEIDRTIAVEVLGNIGEAAADAVPLLTRILSKGTTSEKGRAADALGKDERQCSVGVACPFERLEHRRRGRRKGARRPYAGAVGARHGRDDPRPGKIAGRPELVRSWRGVGSPGADRIGAVAKRAHGTCAHRPLVPRRRQILISNYDPLHGEQSDRAWPSQPDLDSTPCRLPPAPNRSGTY